ncbi:MAG: ABC transporter ATP-binding protein [Clostridiales bacterium]|nr:ABC transporter ATP-binding protein [Candidatus Crickella equi]
MIKLNNVCYAYDGLVALRHVNLDISKGDTVVLQGSNGCGKSTLLKLLNGLIFAEEGEYYFDGKLITQDEMKDSKFSKNFHKRIGFVFQNPDVQLFCNNVHDEIAFGPAQMGLTSNEIEKRVSDLLTLLNIDHLKDRAPYHLSGGEKKRVALASVLSINPEVLVLDEPLAGLDKSAQDWLIDFLQELQSAGKTLIISTHDDNLAHLLGDRIVYMNEDHTIDYVL